jgi:hypothetical protein
MTNFAKTLFNDAKALAYACCADSLTIMPATPWCAWGQHEALSVRETTTGLKTTICPACDALTVVCAHCGETIQERESVISTDDKTGQTIYYCEPCQPADDNYNYPDAIED